MTVALHAEPAGPAAAPALLLGGSLGTTLAMWEPLLTALDETSGPPLRAIPFDHRGHGRSPRGGDDAPSIAAMGADVLALLDRLGLRRASYAGLSIGGMVGIWLAANAPERIETLTLICTSAQLPPAGAWRARAATVRAAGGTAPVADAVFARWLTPAFQHAHPQATQTLREMLLASPPDGYADACEAIAAMDLRGDLPRIQAPTLVIAGQEDEAIPPAHGEQLAAAIPHATLRLLSPAAHIGAVEQAPAVAALLRAQLEAVTPDPMEPA
ncbi:alpha/beta fold hydrolase [Conexibacter sp. JD483]|uniref:alpha/beta fold hydrolase n=1 Tax=unclassified Conexibacter TaxID=2627773 RepID=UPI00271FEC8F|nr:MULTISPECIES: alpha/beta fold hydrolase [unclassified Conexibacter]MDO8184721.1 alpha/beta fold hydrolase [Conexibacter sp. CPCC 205706]MDO8198027.1 alpha/beta fold hydrolase [Conexibacter sp. CPCC 205762]MDR9372308.1 alpha/beta fold hydrolase [Conexibacter sp. JD483]